VAVLLSVQEAVP